MAYLLLLVSVLPSLQAVAKGTHDAVLELRVGDETKTRWIWAIREISVR